MRVAFLVTLFHGMVMAAGLAADDFIGRYIESHCVDCHDSTEKKGGLDLTVMERGFTNAEGFALWVKVYDKIDAGEMPPKKKKRPPAKESAALLKWLSASLIDTTPAIDPARV
jgi:hypothetical protein